MTETPEFAAMVRRMVRAWARRVAEADDVDLAELVAFREDLEQAIATAVQGQRDLYGRSWSDIARACGTTRQAAQQRYGSTGQHSRGMIDRATG